VPRFRLPSQVRSFPPNTPSRGHNLRMPISATEKLRRFPILGLRKRPQFFQKTPCTFHSILWKGKTLKDQTSNLSTKEIYTLKLYSDNVATLFFISKYYCNFYKLVVTLAKQQNERKLHLSQLRGRWFFLQNSKWLPRVYLSLTLTL